MIESHKRDALWASPTHKAAGRVFFVTYDYVIPIACMRYRRGRPEGRTDANTVYNWNL